MVILNYDRLVVGSLVVMLLSAGRPVWPDESVFGGLASMEVSQEADPCPVGRWVLHYGRGGRFGIQKITAFELDLRTVRGLGHTRLYLGTSCIEVPVHPTLVAGMFAITALATALVPILAFLLRYRKEA